MKSEKEKMLAGELYLASDPALTADRLRARQLCEAMNRSDPADQATRQQVVLDLFAATGPDVWLEPPFRCDYGYNIRVGNSVYFNFDCVILDVCEVRIGDFVLFAPGVHVYTATHPLEAKLRRTQEFGQPVTIGSDVWVGGRAIICPGVTIGQRSVIGAGSVVTKDVPPGVLVAGNPARVIRALDSSDDADRQL